MTLKHNYYERTFDYTLKNKVLPFLCAWNWSGSLGGSLAVLSLKRNESRGRKVQQLLGQTDMGILHFDEGLTILCAWNWGGSLGGSIAALSLNRNESGGRKVQQLLGQTDMGILHFDNRIEGPTILVCMELERFLGGSLAVLSLNRKESGGRKVQQLLGQTDMGILHFDNKIEGPTILVCLELERFLR